MGRLERKGRRKKILEGQEKSASRRCRLALIWDSDVDLSAGFAEDTVGFGEAVEL